LRAASQHRLINSGCRGPHLAQRLESIMAQPNVEDVVRTIAADTNTSAEIVSKMYAETWDAYSDGARIMDYMAVLVAKRVRENLRSMAADRH